MTAITQLDVVKNHLRIDGSSEDSLLLIYIDAAEQYANDFCDKKDIPFETFPASVQAAVLLIVADLYENREMQVTKELYSNKTVERLLIPYRKF